MIDLSEIDKSKMRIFSLTFQHCYRYRLLEKEAGDVPTAYKLALMDELLNRFDSELERLRRSNGGSAVAGFDAAGGKARTRKQSVALGRNTR